MCVVKYVRECPGANVEGVSLPLERWLTLADVRRVTGTTPECPGTCGKPLLGTASCLQSINSLERERDSTLEKREKNVYYCHETRITTDTTRFTVRISLDRISQVRRLIAPMFSSCVGTSSPHTFTGYDRRQSTTRARASACVCVCVILRNLSFPSNSESCDDDTVSRGLPLPSVASCYHCPPPRG